jgi:hypothetical protein
MLSVAVLPVPGGSGTLPFKLSFGGPCCFSAFRRGAGITAFG